MFQLISFVSRIKIAATREVMYREEAVMFQLISFVLRTKIAATREVMYSQEAAMFQLISFVLRTSGGLTSVSLPSTLFRAFALDGDAGAGGACESSMG